MGMPRGQFPVFRSKFDSNKMQRSLQFMLRNIANHRSPGFKQALTGVQVRRTMASVADYNFETLKVTNPSEFVYHVEMNRPEKLNSMNRQFWKEMPELFDKISADSDCRAVVLSGAGRLFTAGLDLGDIMGVVQFDEDMDVSRRSMKIRPNVIAYQESFTSIEKCPKPVLAAVHGACIGGGVDLITACDMRYCTQDAFFQIKEVDLGLAADVGTLQRLPKIVGNDSLVRELAYTARRMQSDEAMKLGLVNRVFSDKETLIAGALETANLIATKSPVAVQGTKVNLVYSRDHSVPDSLDYIVTWNMGMLQSEDVMKAAMAFMQKTKPAFSKL